MRLALGQINPTVGDFDGNSQLILDQARQAVERGADLVLFPELALCGYPPRDLIEIPVFLDRNRSALDELALATTGLDAAIVVGYVGPSDRIDELRQLRRGPRRRPSALRAAQDAAAHLRRLRRVALLRSGPQPVGLRDPRPASRAHHLRGLLERQGLWRSPRYPIDPVEELARRESTCSSTSPPRPPHEQAQLRRCCMAAVRHGVPAAMVNRSAATISSLRRFQLRRRRRRRCWHAGAL